MVQQIRALLDVVGGKYFPREARDKIQRFYDDRLHGLSRRIKARHSFRLTNPDRHAIGSSSIVDLVLSLWWKLLSWKDLI
jgi:hypothetical protein